MGFRRQHVIRASESGESSEYKKVSCLNEMSRTRL